MDALLCKYRWGTHRLLEVREPGTNPLQLPALRHQTVSLRADLELLLPARRYEVDLGLIGTVSLCQLSRRFQEVDPQQTCPTWPSSADSLLRTALKMRG